MKKIKAHSKNLHPVAFIRWHRQMIAKNTEMLNKLPKSFNYANERAYLRRENRSHLKRIREYVKGNRSTTVNKFFAENPKNKLTKAQKGKLRLALSNGSLENYNFTSAQAMRRIANNMRQGKLGRTKQTRLSKQELAEKEQLAKSLARDSMIVGSKRNKFFASNPKNKLTYRQSRILGNANLDNEIENINSLNHQRNTEYYKAFKRIKPGKDRNDAIAFLLKNAKKDLLSKPNKFFASNPKNIHPFPDRKSAMEYERWLDGKHNTAQIKPMFKVQTTEGIITVPGALQAFPEMPGHEFIIHRIPGNKGILVSEFHTGRGLASGMNKTSVMKKAKSLLKRIGKGQMDKFVKASKHLNP
jgi:hypothetical protein